MLLLQSLLPQRLRGPVAVPGSSTFTYSTSLQNPVVPQGHYFSKCRLNALGSDTAGNGPLPWLFFRAAALFFILLLLLLLICLTHWSLCKMFSEERSRKSIWKSLFLFNLEMFSINDIKLNIKLTSVSVIRLPLSEPRLPSLWHLQISHFSWEIVG